MKNPNIYPRYSFKYVPELSKVNVVCSVEAQTGVLATVEEVENDLPRIRKQLASSVRPYLYEYLGIDWMDAAKLHEVDGMSLDEVREAVRAYRILNSR